MNEYIINQKICSLSCKTVTSIPHNGHLDHDAFLQFLNQLKTCNFQWMAAMKTKARDAFISWNYYLLLLVLLFAHLLLLYIYECKRNIESKSILFIFTSIMFS